MNTLESFVKFFVDKTLEGVVEIRKRYYLIDESQKELISSIKESSGKDPKHAGIFLGTQDKGTFKPSIGLLDLLGPKTSRKIAIDDKAEWLFLCGRDVFGKSITRAGVEKGRVIVTNSRDEVLGMGKIVAPLSNKDEVVVENKMDKGDFLRRER